MAVVVFFLGFHIVEARQDAGGCRSGLNPGFLLGLALSDTLSPIERSERMSRIPGKGSKPEMKLRRLIHAMGFRYRLHVKELPGTPDLVFPAKEAVIFMHGCFWHRHKRCKMARLPKSRLDFWEHKLEENRKRDLVNQRKLRNMGWHVLVVWECQLSNLGKVAHRVSNFLLYSREGRE